MKTCIKIFIFVLLLQTFTSYVKCDDDEEIIEEDEEISDKKILGGEKAGENQYPYIATLRYWYFNKTGHIYKTWKFCGGAILAPRWIITAAHCMKNKEPGLYENKQLHVGVGIKNQKSDQGQQIAVEEIFQHENYTLGHDDIALLYLEHPIQYNAKSQPIHLPSSTHSLNNLGTVMGWGSRHQSDFTGEGYTDELMALTDIPVTAGKECFEKYGSFRTVRSNHLCIGEVHRSGCKGDSGGPLVQKEDGREVIVGVHSLTGIPCGRFDNPSKYENIQLHINSFIIPTIKSVEKDFDTNILFLKN